MSNANQAHHQNNQAASESAHGHNHGKLPLVLYFVGLILAIVAFLWVTPLFYKIFSLQVRP